MSNIGRANVHHFRGNRKRNRNPRAVGCGSFGCSAVSRSIQLYLQCFASISMVRGAPHMNYTQLLGDCNVLISTEASRDRALEKTVERMLEPMLRTAQRPVARKEGIMKILRYLAVLAIFLVPATFAHAQVRVGVGIGLPVYGGPVYYAPPVCAYGYYDYPPYACAPYGYYGPDWFVGGVFIGAGPWFRGGFFPGGYGYRGGYYGGIGVHPGVGFHGYAGPVARGGVGVGVHPGFAGGIAHASAGGGFHGSIGGGFHGGGRR